MGWVGNLLFYKISSIFYRPKPNPPSQKAKEGAVEESLDQNNNESGFGKDGNPFGDDFDSE